MSRVVWNREEKALLESVLVELFTQQPHRTSEDALREAQGQLPANRRHKITSQKVFSHKPMLQRAREIGAANAERLRIERESRSPDPMPPELSSVGALFELLVDRIVDAVYTKVGAKLRAEYGREVERQFDAELARFNAKERRSMVDDAPSASQMPVLLVIGLLAQQANAVRDQFRHSNVELRFLTAEDAKASRGWPRADHIYLMTKWVSHAVQSKVQAAHTPYTLIDGAVSDLSRRISHYLLH